MMELVDVLNLFNSVVIEIDRITSYVTESFYNNKMHQKEMTLKSLLMKIFDNYNDEINIQIFRSLENWIYEAEGLINSTSFRYLTSKHEDRMIQVEKKVSKTKIMVLLNNVDNLKAYPMLDSLTGVYQKRAFEQLVNSKIEKSTKPFFFGILDIDGFKKLNDTYGYYQGDYVLKKVASILTEAIPDGYIGRIGGDEFAFFCEDDVSYQNVWTRMRKIFDIFNGEKLISANLDMVTFTIGLSRFITDAANYRTLFVKAEKALTRGKIKGRNCFIIYLDNLHCNISLEDCPINERVSQTDALDFISDLVYSLNEEDYKANINRSLIMVRDYFVADYVAMFKVKEDEEELDAITETAAKLYETTIKHSDYHNHSIGGLVNIMYVDEFYKIDESLYNFLYKQNGIVSVLRFDIQYDKKVVGVIEVGNTHAYRSYAQSDIDMIKALGKIFSSYYSKII